MIVVAIAGASGSGKTTLSEQLLKTLKETTISCQLLSMDNYYKERNVSDYPNIDVFRQQLQFYKPTHLCLDQLSADLDLLSKGQSIFQKTFVFSTNLYQRDERGECVLETIEPSDIIILEGLFAQHFADDYLPKDCPRISVNVATSSYLSIMNARKKRDTAPLPLGRALTPEQVRTNEFRFVGPMFFKYTVKHASGSDVYVLNDHDSELNDASFTDAISEIKNKIIALQKDMESNPFVAKEPIDASLMAKASQASCVSMKIGSVDNCSQPTSSRGLSAGSIDGDVRNKSPYIDHAMQG